MEQQKAVKVKLYGELGKNFHKEYNLCVSSISEAIHAININSKRKLYPWLLERDKAGVRYKMIINGEPFKTDKDLNNLNNIQDSELSIKNSKLKTIEIVPVLEGAGDEILGIFTVILGVVLAIVGLAFAGPAWAAPLIVAGLGLIAGGVINLLMRPPKFDDFRQIDSSAGKKSYLFNGPENTVNEGGPVPVGYGRLIVGSQVISAAYVISNISANAILGENDTTPGALDFHDQDGKEISHGTGDYDIQYSMGINKIKSSPILIFRGNTKVTEGYYGYGAERRVGYKFFKDIQDDHKFEQYGGPLLSEIGPPPLLITSDMAGESFFYTIMKRGSLSGHAVLGGIFNIFIPPNRFSQSKLFKNNLIIFSDKNDGGYDGTGDIAIVTANGTVYGSFIKPGSSATNTSGDTFICGDFTEYSSTEIGQSASTITKPNLGKFTKVIDGNGKIRHNATDLSSWSGISASSTIRCVIVDGSDNIFICGNFTSVNGTTRGRVAKLDSTGALDLSFSDPEVMNGTVYDIKLDSNSKLLVAGDFTSVASDTDKHYITRINTNGSNDSSFTSPSFTGSNISIRSIYVQTRDGKILIGGQWDTISDTIGNTLSSKNLARLNTNGSLDTSFISRFDPGEPDTIVYKVLCRDDENFTASTLTDGRIMIGGKWDRYQDKLWPNFAFLYNGEY
jgi:predicted phage tail protein